jgi:hypothetical protein
MKTFKELLIELRAYSDVIEWVEDKTIEEVVDQCHRGDWLLWLAKRVDIGLQPLTLAKAHCANTVRHLMKDERSIKAVDTAIAFGEGKANLEDLNSASTTAYAIAYAAAYATTYAAYNAFAGSSSAAVAAAAAANVSADAAIIADYAAVAIADYAAEVAYAADYTSTSSSAAASAAAHVGAEKQNLNQTADICRKYIGHLIIEKVNELLNTKEK